MRATLTSAAHGMTTLHVRQDELEQAIAAYPVVRALEVSTDFPHGLAIHVVEHRPAALVGGLPVAGDGTILRGLPVEGRLPTIAVKADLRGSHLKDPAALHAARVAGAAPGGAALAARADRAAKPGGHRGRAARRPGADLRRRHARPREVDRRHARARRPRRGGRHLHRRPPARAAPRRAACPPTTLSPVAPAGSAELAPPDTAVAARPRRSIRRPSSSRPPRPRTRRRRPRQARSGGPAPAPATPAPTAPPADTTGAGGVSPPPE